MHSQEQKQVRELGKSRKLLIVHLLFFPYALVNNSIKVGVSLSTNWLFGMLILMELSSLVTPSSSFVVSYLGQVKLQTTRQSLWRYAPAHSPENQIGPLASGRNFSIFLLISAETWEMKTSFLFFSHTLHLDQFLFYLHFPVRQTFSLRSTLLPFPFIKEPASQAYQTNTV